MMNLKELYRKANETFSVLTNDWAATMAAVMMLRNYIMIQPMESLFEEAREDPSRTFLAVGKFNLPIDAVARLVDAVGVDTTDISSGMSAIMYAARSGNCDIVEYLARNRKADLSIRSGRHSVYSLVKVSAYSGVVPTRVTQMYRILEENGVTSDGSIIEGFRSPLSIDDSLLLPTRLGQENDNFYFYLRAMSLSMEDLETEVKERRDDANGEFPLIVAARRVGMEVVVKRIQKAWPGSVNAKDKLGGTAIIQAAFAGYAENVRTLATMGSDLSVKDNDGDTIFYYAEVSSRPSSEKVAVIQALAEHGVTSEDIPSGFQSTLYFKSSYYQENVRTQRWMNRMVLMMCVSSVYKWSLLNQIEDEKYRTLPDDLPELGSFICKCWFDVAGGDNKVDDDTPDNGIGRLIMSFYGGFDESRAKSPFALIGMPEYGKLADTVARCSNCRAEGVVGKKWLRCCGKVTYCSKVCQLADWKKKSGGHKKSCERNKKNKDNMV
jgi:ankyrin repeat protein